MSSLLSRIASKEAAVAVIGLGYVGLPLAVEAAGAGFRVYGVDTSYERTGSLKKGESYVEDVKSSDIKRHQDSGKLSFFDSPSIVEKADAVIICVPTPLRKTGDPDISFITSAVESIKKYMHRDMLIVLESTTFPGTTEEVVKPLIESTGLKAGKDVFIAFSPERVDPGNPKFGTKNIPKIVGGTDALSGDAVETLYSRIFDKVLRVRDSRTAEMVKLLENAFRNVNIAFINEFCLICDRMGVDVWEVIEAAKTKPFGFMPFYPGPGIGGHCITTDPTYLTWKARAVGGDGSLTNLATQINRGMPAYVVTRVEKLLSGLKGKKLLLLGMAYKKDVSDARESPAIEVFRLFRQLGAAADYSDPYVPELRDPETKESFVSKTLSGDLVSSYDCAVLLTDHSGFDYKMIAESAKIIFDTRNAFKGAASDKIVRL